VARTEVAVPESGGGLAGFARGVVDYVRASRAELTKVSWPTRPELVTATRVVLILAVALGLVIGLLDWVLGKILVDGVAALAR
jgi:preprotein translocase subunit SecE